MENCDEKYLLYHIMCYVGIFLGVCCAGVSLNNKSKMSDKF